MNQNLALIDHFQLRFLGLFLILKGKEAVQLHKSVPTHQPPIRIREQDILIPPAPTPPEKWPATLEQPTKPEPTEKEKPAPRRLETRPPPGNPGQWR